MTNYDRSLRTLSWLRTLLPLAPTKAKEILVLSAMMAIASASFAQQAPEASLYEPQTSAQAASSTARDEASPSRTGAAQQRTSDSPPKWGIFAGYASIETNNHNFHFAPGITASGLDYDEHGHGLEVGGVRNLNRYFGIVGLFDAHFSSNSFALGVVPLGNSQFTLVPSCGAQPNCTPQTFHLDPMLFRFTAGPEVSFRNRTRVTPFADVLFGVAHSHATFGTAGQVLTFSRIEGESGFAVNFAAGLEVRVAHRFSFRGSIDYGKAFVGSSDLPSQLVDSIGFSSGLLFRFH